MLWYTDIHRGLIAKSVPVAMLRIKMLLVMMITIVMIIVMLMMAIAEIADIAGMVMTIA